MNLIYLNDIVKDEVSQTAGVITSHIPECTAKPSAHSFVSDLLLRGQLRRWSHNFVLF